ncbi:MAG: DUF1501 domain-containing protein [Planctomycetaceae bacterium]|nr:DUF1501 domain-containing protein [Planctomycetaceae bacterium]
MIDRDFVNHAPTTRRDLLRFAIGGLTSTALWTLLQRDVSGGERHTPAPQRTPKARRVIHFCLPGGYSQVDTFDYKPELERLHGGAIPGDDKPETFFGSAGLLCRPHWKFQRRGESGLWVSELFPHLAQVADHLTMIHSMVADTANHTPATFQQLSGFQTNGFPTLGSWLSYGLGNESDDLPTFVVLPDSRSLPSGGAANWGAGFLPAQHQGVRLRSGTAPIPDLFPAEAMDPYAEKASRELLLQLERKHLVGREANAVLSARMAAFELAARMQVSIPEATDLSQETQATLDSYGVENEQTSDMARRCLIARRLMERGVRFVQLFAGGCFGGEPRHGWDSHEDCRTDHQREAERIDRPVAALIQDLHQRGLLHDTLVLFTTEFGRTPFANAPAGQAGLGRDHNPEGFTVWMAGGGARPGLAYGATDEIGWKAVENPVTWPDFHATVLHLLGIDHTKLTYYHNGIERRLTNVHGHVVDAICK